MRATAQVDVAHRHSLAWKEERRRRKKEGKEKVCALAATDAKNTLPTSSAHGGVCGSSSSFHRSVFHLIITFIQRQQILTLTHYQPVDIT